MKKRDSTAAIYSIDLHCLIPLDYEYLLVLYAQICSASSKTSRREDRERMGKDGSMWFVKRKESRPFEPCLARGSRGSKVHLTASNVSS